MAGAGMERGRKLRGRGATGAPAPPLTRSAAAAAVSSTASTARQDEASRRTITTAGATSKVALKRAAFDDNRTMLTAPHQQAKKRAALANLTNCSNIPSTRPPLRAQVKLKGQAAAFQSREVDVSKENLEPKHGKKYDTNNPIVSQNKGNSSLGRGEGPLDVFKPKASSTACVATQTLASSHDTSQHKLLMDPKPTTRHGYWLDRHVEEEGWSCNNYTDIDDNIKDPQMCCSYAPDIYFHLQMAELKRRPNPNFMGAVQQDINASMRSILVDWLVEVAEEYKLVPDTLYLTIAYVDRFLSGNVVNRQRLQLLGVSCMLIASKYEEICAPQVDEFCFITDNTYTREEVLQMEKRILNYLQFELTGPTTKTFLRRFIRAAQAGRKTPTLQLEFLGNYLAELTLLEYEFIKYLPSMIAASAVFLARVTLDPTANPWNLTLEHYSGYKPSELVECVKAIHDLQCNIKNCTLTAVREKYKQQKFKSIANLAPPAIIPPQYFEDDVVIKMSTHHML